MNILFIRSTLEWSNSHFHVRKFIGRKKKKKKKRQLLLLSSCLPLRYNESAQESQSQMRNNHQIKTVINKAREHNTLPTHRCVAADNALIASLIRLWFPCIYWAIISFAMNYYCNRQTSTGANKHAHENRKLKHTVGDSIFFLNFILSADNCMHLI